MSSHGVMAGQMPIGTYRAQSPVWSSDSKSNNAKGFVPVGLGGHADQSVTKDAIEHTHR
jgi:hypothetical protein